jgi:DnaJ-class molecular chaperone
MKDPKDMTQEELAAECRRLGTERMSHIVTYEIRVFDAAAQMLEKDKKELEDKHRLAQAELDRADDRAEELEAELKEAWHEVRELREENNALREGRCLPCEETDKANNEMRNCVIPKMVNIIAHCITCRKKFEEATKDDKVLSKFKIQIPCVECFAEAARGKNPCTVCNGTGYIDDPNLYGKKEEK